MNKTCTKCNQSKLLTEFFKDKGFKDGYYSRCKSCKTEATLAWRNTNKPAYNAYMSKIRKKHYQRDRLTRYGLNLEDYELMKQAQKGLCAICHTAPKPNKPLVIDHCHNINKVRGLLCYKCNRDMVVLDSPDHLARCAAYKAKS